MKTIEMKRMLSRIIVCLMLITSLCGFTHTVLLAQGDNIELENLKRPDEVPVRIQDAKDNYIDYEHPKYFDDHGKQTFRGVVTEVDYKGYTFIQDSTGGVGVKFGKQVDFKIGDEIEVYGCLGSHYNFEYIKVDDLKFVGKGSVFPMVVELTEIDNDLEGQLITVKNVTIKSGPEYGDEYLVVGGNEDFRIKLKNSSWVNSGVTYDSITGIVYYSYSKYALVPTDEMSIVEDASRVREVTTDVPSGDVMKDQEVTLNTLTKGAQIYYTTDGSKPSTSSRLYSDPVVINSDTELRAIAVFDGLSNSKVLKRSYFISESVGTKTISELQGESHRSPYLYKTVEEVEGIVTAELDYQFDRNGPNIKGFYMQSETGDGNDATSDAIFVKIDRDAVDVGQKVKVSGIVKEHVKEMDFYAYDQGNQLSVTTIDAETVEIVSSDNTLPLATIIGENGRRVPHDRVASADFCEYNIDTYAIDFYESLEAMRVVVEKPQVVAALHNRVLGIVPDGAKIAKEDGDLSVMGGIILQENDVNTEILSLNKAIGALNGVDYLRPGASSTGQVEGIMEYEWGTYQIYITKDLPAFINVECQKDTLKFNPRDDELTIASYNVYNHGGNANAEKTTGIARSIVHDMKSPDIVGLVEIQDNDGTSGGTKSKIVDASKTYEAFIESIRNEGGPTYKWVDIVPVDDQEGGAPGGNIRVGFLYNPVRVSLKTGVDKGTSTQTVQVDENGHLTLNPGRIAATAEAFEETRKSLAAEFVFNGEEVIVIANHFSSKGGDNGIYGNVQPPVKHSEVNRIKQAQLVNDFVDNLLAKNPEARVVVLGDMNDFHFSKAVKALQGEGSEKVLINMINCLPLAEQFTYNYGGNSQVLDHILVSMNIADYIRADVLNINSIISDEDKANRHSDHDAVVGAIGGIR